MSNQRTTALMAFGLARSVFNSTWRTGRMRGAENNTGGGPTCFVNRLRVQDLQHGASRTASTANTGQNLIAKVYLSKMENCVWLSYWFTLLQK